MKTKENQKQVPSNRQILNVILLVVLVTIVVVVLSMIKTGA